MDDRPKKNDDGGYRNAKNCQAGDHRVVVAIIVAALVIGSSIIIHSGFPPLISGVPIIGLTGVILAALLGIWVIISVLRDGIS